MFSNAFFLSNIKLKSKLYVYSYLFLLFSITKIYPNEKVTTLSCTPKSDFYKL